MPDAILNDIPAERYHADALTDVPALSQSVMKILLNQSPAHARDRHPKLTMHPRYEWPQTDAMKAGSVAHSMLLGAGDRYKVFVASDYMTKENKPAKTLGCDEAQKAIAAWRASGGLDISEKTMSSATAITDGMLAELLALCPMWPNGKSEVTLLFSYKLNDGSEIQCKGRIDRLVANCVCVELAEPHIHAFDPKFTSRQASDAWIDKTGEVDGWFIQDAMYTIGLEKVLASIKSSKRILFSFVVGELYPPYAVRLVTLADSWREDGRREIDRGANIWGKCLASGIWPKRAGRYTARRPEWAANMNRELAALMDSVQEES